MATLRVTPVYTLEVSADELRLLHRGLHLLSAHKNAETAEPAKALAAKLAADRKYEFDSRGKELEKLLTNIEKGVPPPKADADLAPEF